MKTPFEKYITEGIAEGLQPDEEGGVCLPPEAEAKVNAMLAEASPMRKLASILIVKGAGTGELYAMPAATASLLDDMVDCRGWLAEECKDVFAAQESASFINGDGVNKPRGFLQDADKLKTLSSPDISVASLISLIYMLAPKHRQHGSFILNRRTLGEVRKLKDTDGNYIWQPSSDVTAPSKLLGYPVAEMEDMPDMSPMSRPIAFGDFRAGYQITDRQGVRVLRDPYSAKPYVLFYTTKRVGGGVENPDAIATLQLNT